MKPKLDLSKRLKDRSPAFKAIFRIMRPLARLMLHQGLPATESIEALKVAFVESAENDFPIEGKKASNARVSILTGFDRNTTARIRDGRGARSEHYYNRAERCARGWHEHPNWQGQTKPLDLPFTADADTPCFEGLVKAFSGGVSPYPMLDEMQRAGMVNKLPNGQLQLVKSNYDQKLGTGPEGKPVIQVVGEQVHSMINVMAQNIVEPTDGKTRLQQMHSYKNITDEEADQLNEICKQANAYIIARMTEWDDQRQKNRPSVSAETGLVTEGTHVGSDPRKTGISINFFDDKPNNNAST